MPHFHAAKREVPLGKRKQAGEPKKEQLTRRKRKRPKGVCVRLIPSDFHHDKRGSTNRAKRPAKLRAAQSSLRKKGGNTKEGGWDRRREFSKPLSEKRKWSQKNSSLLSVLEQPPSSADHRRSDRISVEPKAEREEKRIRSMQLKLPATKPNRKYPPRE